MKHVQICFRASSHRSMTSNPLKGVLARVKFGNQNLKLFANSWSNGNILFENYSTGKVALLVRSIRESS